MNEDLLKAIYNYEEILLFGVGNTSEEIEAKRQLTSAILNTYQSINSYNKHELELLKKIIYKYDVNEKEITRRSR